MRSTLAPLAIVALFGATAKAGDLHFEESAQPTGLTGGHVVTNDYGMQYMAAGAAVGDFDRDGDQDVFVIGGSEGVDQLYINAGDGTFTERAAAWGVDAAGLRHTGAAVGDYDGDGWLDVYVTAVSPQDTSDLALNRLYRNNGDGTFTDVAAAAGVQVMPSQLSDSFGAAFGDYDLDGDLDLFVCGWTGGNTLFRNEGDGTFAAQPDTVFGGPSPGLVHGFAPRFTDVNGDGLPDLLVTADFFSSRLYLNDGDGTFTNATSAWGAGLDSNGMGATTGDFNNDGRIDWYVTSVDRAYDFDSSGNMLYINGGGSFEERSIPAGVNDGGWGWGTDAADFDHDGWLDLAATNGFAGPLFTEDETLVWLNQRDDHCLFLDVTEAVGVTHTGQGRGLLTFDADLDGDRDMLITSNGEALTYYRNELPNPGASTITLFFDTSGAPALAPDGFGTHVSLTARGFTQVRYLDGGNNYLSQSELSMHFGLGAAGAAEEVVITWADGGVTTLRSVLSGRYVITARPGCPADWVVDGLLDLADLTGWTVDFLAGHPQADMNADGLHDLTDISAFVQGFAAGCP